MGKIVVVESFLFSHSMLVVVFFVAVRYHPCVADTFVA